VKEFANDSIAFFTVNLGRTQTMTQHDDSDAMPHRGEVTDVSACYQRLTPRSAKLYRNSLLWSKTVVGRVTDLLHLTLLLNFTEIASFWKKKFYFRFFNVAW